MFHPLRLTACVVVFCSLISACAVVDSPLHHEPGSVPTDTVRDGRGEVLQVRTSKNVDRFFVIGTVRPDPLTKPAHVDVQLIDAAGEVIAEKRVSLRESDPRTARSRAHAISFVASFPIDEAQRARRARVVYHQGVEVAR